MRILFVAANPSVTTPLRLGEELREIEAKLERSSLREDIQLNSAFATRPGDLLQQMGKIRPHVLHFSGHGAETGEIVMEADDGRAKPVTAAALKALFEAFRPELQVVLLNACFSSTQANAFVDTVDAVVGMNSSIGDKAAIVFAAAFYQALGFGRSVAEAFKQGTTAILLEGISEANTPVLLHRPSTDPSMLTLSSSPALVRAHDPRVPEHLRQLLLTGTTLLMVTATGEDETGSNPIFFELALRHAGTKYVVEASPRATVSEAASLLAARLMPSREASMYDWSLVRRDKRKEQQLAAFHTLGMAGITSGDVVLLVGNHRMPTWMPSPAR